MKPGYLFLFLLFSIFIILEVAHFTNADEKDGTDKPKGPKNRYIVEKTQNVTEKREAVPENVDNDFQESFRKVRKVHKKLINHKLHQYDETEDLERKRIKDSGNSTQKNIAEVQHVIQKMKIVENPSYTTDKQKNGAVKEAGTLILGEKQNTVQDSETQKDVVRSKIITQEDEDAKKKIIVKKPIRIKRKKIIGTKVEQEAESDETGSIDKKQKKKYLAESGREDNQIIRTVYVTKGHKNAVETEEEGDNIESEYNKLKESIAETASDAEKTTVDKEKHTEEENAIKKTITETKDIKEIETDRKKTSDSKPIRKIRKIVIRKPKKIKIKNIKKTATEEEEIERRTQKDTYTNNDMEFLPVMEKKKVIIKSETENDKNVNSGDMTEEIENIKDSKVITEKEKDEDDVKYVIIKRKNMEGADKVNTEDGETISNSEEVAEKKTDITLKRKPVRHRVITKIITEDEKNVMNDDSRKRTVKLSKNDSDLEKETIYKHVNEKEVPEISIEKDTVDTQVQEDEKINSDIEKPIYTTVLKPENIGVVEGIKPDLESSNILQKENVDKKPVKGKRRKIIRIITEEDGQDVKDEKAIPKRIKVSTTNKNSEYFPDGNKEYIIPETGETGNKLIYQVKKQPKDVSEFRNPKERNKDDAVTSKTISKYEIPEKSVSSAEIPKESITFPEDLEPEDKTHPVSVKRNIITESEMQPEKPEIPKKDTDEKKPTENVKKVKIDYIPRVIDLKQKIEPKIPEENSEIYDTEKRENNRVTHLKKSTSIDEPQIRILRKKTLISPEGSERGEDPESINHIDKTKNTDESHTVIVKKEKLVEPEIRKEDIRVSEEWNKIKNQLNEIESDDNRKKIHKSYPLIVKKIIRPETPKDDSAVSEIENKVKTEPEEVKPSDKTGKVSHRVIVKKIRKGKPEILQDSTKVSEIDNEIKPTHEKFKPTDEITNIQESYPVLVRKRLTIAPETQKKDTEVSEINSITKKQLDEIKPADKRNEIPESRVVIVNKKKASELETKKQDNEVSELDSKLKKQPGPLETMYETKDDRPEIVKKVKIIKSKAQKNEIDNERGKEHVIVKELERDNAVEKEKMDEPLVTIKKTIESTEENLEQKKKTKGKHYVNELKDDSYLTIGSTNVADTDVKKDKPSEDASIKHKKIIKFEPEKVDVDVEKKHIVVSDEIVDKGKKHETVIKRKKKISTPEKISDKVKTNTTSQEDAGELVERDEIITDTQVIEEEVDDTEAAARYGNVKGAQSAGSTVIGAVKSAYDSGTQKEIAGAYAGVSTNVLKHSKGMYATQENPVESTELLFMLQNDENPIDLNDSTVAVELSSKLTGSKTQSYTTYHVRRDKNWSINSDFMALVQRIEDTARKIQDVYETSKPYIESVVELQKISAKYIQDGYRPEFGTQVKLQIKQFEKLQKAYYKMEAALQNERSVVVELGIKAMCEFQSGIFKLQCFKEQYPEFDKYVTFSESDKQDCYADVRKMSELAKVLPDLWMFEQRKLERIQETLEHLRKYKEGPKPGEDVKQYIASLVCDIVNFLDVQTKFLNFSAKLEGVAKLARREINICNKKEMVDPAAIDADK